MNRRGFLKSTAGAIGALFGAGLLRTAPVVAIAPSSNAVATSLRLFVNGSPVVGGAIANDDGTISLGRHQICAGDQITIEMRTVQAVEGCTVTLEGWDG